MHNFALKSLPQVENLLLEASEKEIEGELDILKSLREELVLRRTQLIYSISEVRKRVKKLSY